MAVEAAALYLWTRPVDHGGADSGIESKNPVTLRSAFQFAALYAAVLFVAKVLIDRASEAALSVVGAVSGINDVDAITLAMVDQVARSGLDPVARARAVVAAVTVNTLVKGGMAAVLGSRAPARSIGVIPGPAGAVGALAWILL